jgi:hypothetical protein
MSGIDRVKKLLKEARVYKEQGLLAQAKERYFQALHCTEEDRGSSEASELVEVIRRDIHTVERQLAEMNQAEEAPDLSSETRDLIRELFSFSKDRDAAALESAMALAQFGQNEQALAEFRVLLERGIMPLMAAKNIIRCLVTTSGPVAAVEQFNQWIAEEVFSKPDLRHIRDLIERILVEQGVHMEIPEVDKESYTTYGAGEYEEDPLRIFSALVKPVNGSARDDPVELEVTSHSENMVRLVVASNRKDLMDSFRPGAVLPDMQFYAPMGVFRCEGKVSARRRITRGPKSGDYIFDIMINGNPE